MFGVYGKRSFGAVTLMPREEAADPSRDFARRSGQETAMQIILSTSQDAQADVRYIIFHAMNTCIQQLKEGRLFFCENAALTNFMEAFCEKLNLSTHIRPEKDGSLDTHRIVNEIATKYSEKYIAGQSNFYKYKD